MTRKDFRDWGCQEKISTEKWESWGKKEKEVFRGRSDLWEGRKVNFHPKPPGDTHLSPKFSVLPD